MRKGRGEDYGSAVASLALLFVPNRVILSLLTRRTLDEISDAAWRELSDPLNFVVGAVLLTFAAFKHGALSSSKPSSLPGPWKT